MDGSPKERSRVLELLRRFGRNTCSFQSLETGLAYWWESADACVAYMDTGSAWIAAGEPIAPPERMPEVAEKFVQAARNAGRRARFFAVEESLGAAFGHTPIGTQPVWNPQNWPQTLRGKRSLREQLRRARAKGVHIREIRPEETELGHPVRQAIDRLISRWLESRALAPMGFLVELDVYQTPEERRFLIAEKPVTGSADRELDIVGILVAVPVFARGGWFFEDVLRDPSAPNGTVELLFDHAMRLCAADGATHATFGLAPLADVSSRPLAWIRDHTRWLYDFDGLRRFKAKLEPHTWESVYLSYPAGERGFVAIVDSLRAFARGSFLGFAWRTLIHRAHATTLVLTALLVPWTAWLALMPGEYFPSQAIQWAWVGYDVVLLLLLGVLLGRWHRLTASILATLAGIDFTLGCAQLILYNLGPGPGVLGFWPAAVTVSALLAPAFATCFLWASRGRYSPPVPLTRAH